MKYLLLNCIFILFLGAFILMPDAHAAAWGVSNTADTPIGQACAGFTNCSLREAITSTELNPGPDAILIQSGTYTLANGSLTITQDLTIARVGAGTVTISGNNAMRLFDVSGSGTDAIFRFLTLSGGSATMGGAINVGVGSSVSVESTTISGSSATQGGAIYNAGTLILRRASGSLTNTIISSNNTASSGAGGGIFNAGGGSVTINLGTLIGSNSAASGVGGGINNAAGAFLTINSGVTISNNSASAGGGIYHNGVMSITGTTLNNNSAPSGGGALYIDTFAASSTITSSTINDNSAASVGGGGAKIHATTTFTNTTFSNNNGFIAGGLVVLAGAFPVTVTLTNCTLTLNRSDFGGGFSVGAGSFLLQNSIVAGNTKSDGTTPNDVDGTVDPPVLLT